MQGSILVSDVVERRHGRALDDAAPGIPRIVLGPEGLEEGFDRIEVAFFSGDLYPARARQFWRPILKATSLRWLHTYSAGVDDPVFQRIRQRGVRLSTSSGASAVPLAHAVMLDVLAFSLDLQRWLGAQERHAWEPGTVRELQGRTLGVIGLGPIGREVARLGAAFGLRVIGVRRTPHGDEPCEVWSLERLPDLLAIADFLVLALPLTDETRHLIGSEALSLMKREAVVINVGRGALIDEPALVQALTEKRIAGAALDVFEVEPLPASSPLWDLPNVILTPHSIGASPGNDARATAMFLDNLRRYVAGEPLRNEVAEGPDGCTVP